MPNLRSRNQQGPTGPWMVAPPWCSLDFDMAEAEITFSCVHLLARKGSGRDRSTTLLSDVLLLEAISHVVAGYAKQASRGGHIALTLFQGSADNDIDRPFEIEA